MHKRRRGMGIGLMAGPVVAVALVIGGCGAPPVPLSELNASYERALAHSAPLAVVLDSETGERAFGNLQRYFGSITPESVRELTATVYAPTGYLNDTLVGIQGVSRIEAYFGDTARKVDLVKVEFLDRATVGIDWYVRWRMTVAADGLNGGAPVITYGVSQLRFDADGRVLLHKDFWDSGTGLYEQVPVLGTIVGRIRAASEPGDDEQEL
jgi:hypothetical protein